MPEPIVIGFPGSTYVHIIRLILTHKNVPYRFRDLEPEMGTPAHIALHPFGRVPVLPIEDESPGPDHGSTTPRRSRQTGEKSGSGQRKMTEIRSISSSKLTTTVTTT